MGKKCRSGVKFQLRRAIAIALGGPSGKVAGNSARISAGASCDTNAPPSGNIADGSGVTSVVTTDTILKVLRDNFELGARIEKRLVSIARVLPTPVRRPTFTFDEPEPYIPEPVGPVVANPAPYHPQPTQPTGNPKEDSDASTVEIVRLE